MTSVSDRAPIASAVQSTRSRPAGRGRNSASSFAALLQEVRAAGLLEKRPGYYVVLTTALGLLGAALIVALVRLGRSPWQLAVAAGLGLVLAQLGFIAHEAAHRQVFRRGPANDLAALLIGSGIVGLSYTWWQDSHNRHHAHPNVVGSDPSVSPGVLVFRASDALRRTGLARAFARVQGFALPPLLLLEGFDLHIKSVVELARRCTSWARAAELVLLLVRLAALPVLVYLLLPVGLATAFLLVQISVFGLWLGGSFVPNHVGMPMLEAGTDRDYLQRQVSTSRNLAGGRVASALTGGLSLQIEHHLFPGMARPNLLKARPIVRRHCEALGIPYTETSVVRAWRDVVSRLNRVSSGASLRFSCPVTEECGRS